ncbi:FAD-binding domain-containing protein [Pholiota conissans]|uniref:FAD-binding domain-containing protein n=1 Tax=Pholiota conissans TaxID=109636 RepID=A0A9P5Z6I3_9AGAR|nr:FAD-binding domain-containing protein [Pholiota conissans]
MEALKNTGAIVVSKADGEEAYTSALKRNSALSVLEAEYVIYPTEIRHIPAIIAYATSQSPPIEIAVKCGGAHSSTWASSNGGIVIDLARLDAVRVSEDKATVVVQGGTTWGKVYIECQKANVDVVGGPFWFVGVGGYLTGGGYSPFTPERGLAIDNILSAVVVLADGRTVRTSATEEPDLFWAIRGGGNQFGIVVEFTLKAFPPGGPFTVGIIAYPGTEIEKVLKVVQDWKATYTTREKMNITFARPAPHFKPAVTILPWVSQDASGRSAEVLAPFRALKPILDTCAPVPDMLAVSHSLDGLFAVAPPHLTIRGALISDLWTDLMLGLFYNWVAFTEENPDAKSTTVLWELSGADKIAAVGSTETAFHAREPHFWVAIQGRSSAEESVPIMRKFVAESTEYMRRENRKKTGKDAGYFINFAQGEEPIEEVFGPNLPRLRKLKAKYDPKKVWSKGCLIEPDFD